MSPVFDHIAIAAPKVTDAPEFLVGELGGISGYGGPSGDFSWWHWDFEGGGRIEIIEPDGPEGGFVHRHLAARGPSIHHVNFEVESLRKSCDLAEQLGFSVVGYDDSHEYWQEAFLHPKSAMGIVVQLVQETQHDHDGEWEHPNVDAPAEPADPPSAVTVVGLRMRSNDAAAARRLWGELLRGEMTEQEGELVFTWPGSPMRVAVTIEEGSENGPLAIEVRSDRTLALPDDRHAALGTRFLQL
jgi:catechol 2,3-dioxygenase-like lactoylglutathione lyase family enzyme